MADLVIEFVSEEIPARMQANAGRDLARLIESALTTLGVWRDESAATGLCAPRHLLAYISNIGDIGQQMTWRTKAGCHAVIMPDAKRC